MGGEVGWVGWGGYLRCISASRSLPIKAMAIKAQYTADIFKCSITTCSKESFLARRAWMKATCLAS